MADFDIFTNAKVPFTIDLRRVVRVGEKTAYADNSAMNAHSVIAIHGPMSADERLLIISGITEHAPDNSPLPVSTENFYAASVDGEGANVEIKPTKGSNLQIDLSSGNIDGDKQYETFSTAWTDFIELLEKQDPKGDRLVFKHRKDEKKRPVVSVSSLVQRLKFHSISLQIWRERLDLLIAKGGGRTEEDKKVRKLAIKAWMTVAAFNQAARHPTIMEEQWIPLLCNLDWLSKNARVCKIAENEAKAK